MDAESGDDDKDGLTRLVNEEEVSRFKSTFLRTQRFSRGQIIDTLCNHRQRHSAPLINAHSVVDNATPEGSTQTRRFSIISPTNCSLTCTHAKNE